MQIVSKGSTAKIFMKKEPLVSRSKNKLVKVLPIKAYRKSALKRLSPFFLLAFLLPIIFLYSLAKQNLDGEGIFVHIFLLLFLEINVLFADFVIWNYYRYKKIIGIW